MTPYFYIIKHISKNMFYAGSKWGQDANPNTFMKKDGYTTSSRKINDIIQEEGLEAFEIVELFTDTDDVYEYETIFLQFNDCASDPNWYNKHNNEVECGYGSTRYKIGMLEKYGVDHPAKSKEILSNREKTYIERYGVDNFSQTDEFRRFASELMKQTMQNQPTEKCIHCERNITGWANINVHSDICKSNPNRKDDRIKYHCSFCKGVFTTKINFENYHGINCKSNPNKINNVKLYDCAYCGKQLDSLGNYKRWHDLNCKEYKNAHQ